jgi:hypothetical protein
MSKNTQKYIDDFCSAICPDYPNLISVMGMDAILIQATEKIKQQNIDIAKLKDECNRTKESLRKQEAYVDNLRERIAFLEAHDHE